MSIQFVDGARAIKYLAADGTGTTQDPYVKLVRVAPQTYTPSLTIATSTGTIAAGATSVSIANTGGSSGTVLGTSLGAGVTLDWTAPSGGTIGEISYNATGSTFLIQELR